MYNIHIVVEIEGVSYVSNNGKNACFEYAVMAFQKMLPENIKIACCESCRHGNFCPYGDQENEVFCFKDKVFSEKMDVCNEFTNEKEYWTRSKKLLDYCDDYEPMDHENHYTYTSWDV